MVDTPEGGSNKGIPDDHFGLRVRLELVADDDWGEEMLAKMISQLRAGKVNAVEMLSNQTGRIATVDVALVFDRETNKKPADQPAGFYYYSL